MQKKRMTIQQRLIMDALRELNCHASAELVYEHIARKYPSISKGTIYRNLSRMVNEGELLNIGDVGGSSRFDHNCHHHYHFICDNCSRIFDVEKYFEDLCERAGESTAFKITGHSVIFNGICAACADNGAMEAHDKRG